MSDLLPGTLNTISDTIPFGSYSDSLQVLKRLRKCLMAFRASLSVRRCVFAMWIV